MGRTREEVETELRDLLTGRFGVPEHLVSPEAHIFDDLGLDSVDLLSAVAILEERHDLTFDDEDMQQILVIDSLVDHIHKLLEKA